MSAPHPDRPNFFDLLELDPDMLWEPQGKQAYERQLQIMRAKWASLRNAPGKAGEDAGRYYRMLQNRVIQEVMEDSAKRPQEAAACRSGQADRRAQLMRVLENWKMHSSTVTQQQISRWSHDFAMSPGDVNALALRIGLTTPADGAAVVSARIDPTVLRNVREKLDALGKLDPPQALHYETLYTFLEMRPSASATDLAWATRKLYSDLARNLNKTHKLTLMVELTGFAMTIFRTEESRRQYDEALRLEPLERLIDGMETMTGGTPPLAPHIKAYYADAARAGFYEHEARQELEVRAKQRKWDIFNPSPVSEPSRKGSATSGSLRIFLSHSHADNAWCLQLVDALTTDGFDVWFDKQGLFVGDQWVAKLETEVESRDVFLIVLTTDSWNSPWVKKELQLALHRNKRIIGIIHKPVTLTGFILTYQILDAAGHDAAQVARQVAERLKA